MADKPADVDPREWSPENAPTVIEVSPDLLLESQAVPTELMAEPNTDPHGRSAEFLAGVEVGRAEGERDGFARGFASGKTDGRADVRAEDFAAGRAEGHDDFRRAMIASGTPPAIALIERDKLREWARANPSAR